MKKLLCAIAAVGLLGACADEAEVEEEVIADAGLADTTANEPAMAPANAGWDADGDSRFQQAEYTTFGETNFNAWDADANSSLTEDEFNAGWTQAGWDDSEGAFSTFDDNSDGVLDDNEFFGEDEWGEWDANSDGLLDENEWTY